MDNSKKDLRHLIIGNENKESQDQKEELLPLFTVSLISLTHIFLDAGYIAMWVGLLNGISSSLPFGFIGIITLNFGLPISLVIEITFRVIGILINLGFILGSIMEAPFFICLWIVYAYALVLNFFSMWAHVFWVIFTYPILREDEKSRCNWTGVIVVGFLLLYIWIIPLVTKHYSAIKRRKNINPT
uniref:Uncharacterized protein n=1 Tax=Lepeophtheirus salmonis TaxID=72036 RepID=A0A0K2TKW1_LEPSM